MKKLLIIVPFLCALVVSCDKEISIDTDEMARTFTVQKINFQDFERQVKNDQIFNSLKSKTISSVFQKSSSNDSLFINPNNIIAIETEHHKTYTFQVYDLNDYPDSYNLMVEVDSLNHIAGQTLLRYDPDSNWLLDTTQPFFGDIHQIHNSSFQIPSNLLKSNSANRCITDMSAGWTCNLGNEHYEGHPDCDRATSWEYVVSFEWGPCPSSPVNSIDLGDSTTIGTIPPFEPTNPIPGGNPINMTTPETDQDMFTLPIMSDCVGTNTNGFSNSGSSPCFSASQMVSEIDQILGNLMLSKQEKQWILSSQDNMEKTHELFLLLKENHDPNNDYAKLAFKLAFKMLVAQYENLTPDQQNQLIISIVSSFNVTAGPFMEYFSLEYAALKRDHPDWSNEKLIFHSGLAVFQTLLDIVGLIPGPGEFADIANGLIYTATGDGVNAGLSFGAAIPFAGWASTGIKVIRKYDRITRVTFKISHDASTNIYKFVGRSGKLRKALGLAKGDPRIAHHLIPSEFINHPAVQKAAGQGFHIDEAINGFPIESIRHSGSHPNYSNIVRSKLDNLDLNNSTFMTDFQNIMLDIETAIINNPNTHINQLIF